MWQSHPEAADATCVCRELGAGLPRGGEQSLGCRRGPICGGVSPWMLQLQPPKSHRPALLLVLCQHSHRSGSISSRAASLCRFGSENGIYPQQSKTTGSPRGRAVRARGTSFLPSSLGPPVPRDQRWPWHSLAPSLEEHRSCPHWHELLSLDPQEQSWASRDLSHFLLSAPAEPGARGEAALGRSLPGAPRQAPACICCTWGWMWSL